MNELSATPFEPGEEPREPFDARGGAEASLPAFLQRWWGGSSLALAGVVGYFFMAQIFPGIVVGIYLVGSSGGSLAPAQIEEQMIPYLPWITFCGLPVAMAMLGLLRISGLLAPGPVISSRTWKAGLWVAGLSAACLLGSQGIAWLQGALGWEINEQELIVKALKEGGLAMQLAIVVGAPLAEELVFRRFLFSSLLHSYGRPIAYIGSAILFALVHLHFPAFFLYLWMASCFAVAYERVGIWGAISVHAVNNLTSVLVN